MSFEWIVVLIVIVPLGGGLLAWLLSRWVVQQVPSQLTILAGDVSMHPDGHITGFRPLVRSWTLPKPGLERIDRLPLVPLSLSLYPDALFSKEGTQLALHCEATACLYDVAPWIWAAVPRWNQVPATQIQIFVEDVLCAQLQMVIAHYDADFIAEFPARLERECREACLPHLLRMGLYLSPLVLSSAPTAPALILIAPESSPSTTIENEEHTSASNTEHVAAKSTEVGPSPSDERAGLGVWAAMGGWLSLMLLGLVLLFRACVRVCRPGWALIVELKSLQKRKGQGVMAVEQGRLFHLPRWQRLWEVDLRPFRVVLPLEAVPTADQHLVDASFALHLRVSRTTLFLERTYTQWLDETREATIAACRLQLEGRLFELVREQSAVSLHIQRDTITEAWRAKLQAEFEPLGLAFDGVHLLNLHTLEGQSVPLVSPWPREG